MVSDLPLLLVLVLQLMIFLIYLDRLRQDHLQDMHVQPPPEFIAHLLQRADVSESEALIEVEARLALRGDAGDERMEPRLPRSTETIAPLRMPGRSLARDTRP